MNEKSDLCNEEDLILECKGKQLIFQHKDNKFSSFYDVILINHKGKSKIGYYEIDKFRGPMLESLTNWKSISYKDRIGFRKVKRILFFKNALRKIVYLYGSKKGDSLILYFVGGLDNRIRERLVGLTRRNWGFKIHDKFILDEEEIRSWIAILKSFKYEEG